VIFVLDNYDSFTYNLVHLVEAQVENVKVVRNDQITVEEIERLAPDGLLISPGPGRPSDAGITEALIRRLGAEIPILGVCLGHQAIGEVFGGQVVGASEPMHGKTSRVHHDGQSVFAGLEQDFQATRYHSLVLGRDDFPEGKLEITAESEDGTIMGLRHRTLPIEGIQFHPESVLTKAGPALIANWVRSTDKRHGKSKRHGKRGKGNIACAATASDENA
jgi:anthranilate synthase/aminodeoxychorismate synthase-like glutamine amidotransferase